MNKDTFILAILSGIIFVLIIFMIKKIYKIFLFFHPTIKCNPDKCPYFVPMENQDAYKKRVIQ